MQWLIYESLVSQCRLSYDGVHIQAKALKPAQIYTKDSLTGIHTAFNKRTNRVHLFPLTGHRSWSLAHVVLWFCLLLFIFLLVALGMYFWLLMKQYIHLHLHYIYIYFIYQMLLSKATYKWGIQAIHHKKAITREVLAIKSSNIPQKSAARTRSK